MESTGPFPFDQQYTFVLCVFPFIYQGQSHSGCITSGRELPWCSVPPITILMAFGDTAISVPLLVPLTAPFPWVAARTLPAFRRPFQMAGATATLNLTT